MLNITNQKFGRLLATKCVGSKNNIRQWEFICDCGNIIIKSASLVKFGAINSCGCLAKELTSKRRFKDLTGKRFGRLLILYKNGVDNHNHITWMCKCDCGKEKSISGNSLVSKNVKSCGCLQKEIARKMRLNSKTENPISSTKEYRSALRKRLRENPIQLMHERLSRLINHSLKNIGKTKNNKTFEMLGYSDLELKNHIEKQFVSKMNWENRNKWQIDHIIPISTAKNEKDVIALNQLSNLRPLWTKENNLKKAKITTLL